MGREQRGIVGLCRWDLEGPAGWEFISNLHVSKDCVTHTHTHTAKLAGHTPFLMGFNAPKNSGYRFTQSLPLLEGTEEPELLNSV